jgi:hypothetical protein
MGYTKSPEAFHYTDLGILGTWGKPFCEDFELNHFSHAADG